MKNRTITNLLLITSVLLFIVYFTILKIGVSHYKINDQLNDIINYAQQENWDAAQNATNHLIKTWENGKHFLAINYAEADFSFFLDSIARLQGAIDTKDTSGAVAEALSTHKLWDNYTKIIPEP